MHSLVHDWNDEPSVAVWRQELQIYEVVDQAIPVAVGQVDGGAHHGLPVWGGDLSHQAKVQKS